MSHLRWHLVRSALATAVAHMTTSQTSPPLDELMHCITRCATPVSAVQARRTGRCVDQCSCRLDTWPPPQISQMENRPLGKVSPTSARWKTDLWGNILNISEMENRPFKKIPPTSARWFQSQPSGVLTPAPLRPRHLPPPPLQVTLTGGAFSEDVKGREVKDVFRAYVQRAHHRRREVTPDLENEVKELTVILCLGSKEARTVMDDVSAKLYKKLLRDEVVSGR